MGIAIMSVLTPYYDTPHERIKERIIGVVIGSFAFFIIYSVLPNSFVSLIGPISGLCLGLCASYKWSSIFWNGCFSKCREQSYKNIIVRVYSGSVNIRIYRIFGELCDT